ncbi:MAG: uracil-DNA glycosylase [Cellvibrionaceae bacterium]
MEKKPEVKLNETWLNELSDQFSMKYMIDLKSFLKKEKEMGKVIYPQGDLIFNAFNTTPFDKVKVVILGQDPYHGPSQAHGLCFSVLPGVKVPPSLRNIYKELESDLGITTPDHGYLQSWAEQGVLMLNATLTVEKSKAGSHQGKGWEQLTDAAIQALNSKREHLVFLLWGKYAQQKGELIDRGKHLVLESTHPSPFSAHRGFLGCRHFSLANEYLKRHEIHSIDWRISEHKEN